MPTVNTPKARKKNKYLTQPFFFAKNKDCFNRIEIQNILFIKSKDGKSMVTTRDNKIATDAALNEIVEPIKLHGFYRCHKKYFVYIANIDTIDMLKNQLTIGGYTIPIDEEHKRQFILSLVILK